MSWGLVLSGGGAFGIANAGVIEVLEREKLRPDCIAGSSMGAIVGGLYALGHSPGTMRKLCESISVWTIATMSSAPLEKGLHGGILRQRLREILDTLLEDALIGDCKIPFVCVAGRVKEPIRWQKIIQSGFTSHVRECIEKYVFPPETPMIDALLASSAIPVIFSPATVGNDTFVDLLSFGAVPCRTLRELHHPDRIIATDTNPRYAHVKNFLPPGWKEFLEEGEASLQESLRACDLVLKPHLKGSTFSFGQAEKYYGEGKKEAEECLSDIKKVLGS